VSYTSTSVVAKSTKLRNLEELVALLGYKKQPRWGIKNQVGDYFWYDESDYRSWVGVELQIYRRPSGQITIDTRSVISRSYWDLVQQNKTIQLIRELFGGHFITDEGRNRRMLPGRKPPTPLASGCYLARMRFQSGLKRAQIYLMNRKLDGPVARNNSSGFYILDDMNPRLLSNNLLLPYVIAVWEDYFRSTFAAALRYTSKRESALKRARLDHADLDKVAVGAMSMEQAVAEAFSFQRPSAIGEHFRMLDPKLDVAGALRRPYRRRKTSLFDRIEQLVEDRNEFVHTGGMNLSLFDSEVKAVLSDITVAVERSYDCVAKHYGFLPKRDF
jgi:hypothetical protein